MSIILKQTPIFNSCASSTHGVIFKAAKQQNKKTRISMIWCTFSKPNLSKSNTRQFRQSPDSR